MALLDLGAKRNIARSLNERGCRGNGLSCLHHSGRDHRRCIRTESCFPTALEIPRSVWRSSKRSRSFMIPIFRSLPSASAISSWRWQPAETPIRLKYGHRGGNHPVKDLATGRVYISSQNHGYVVDTDSLDAKDCGSGICECQRRDQRGSCYTRERTFSRFSSTRRHAPDRRIPAYLFDRFLKMMEVND